MYYCKHNHSLPETCPDCGAPMKETMSLRDASKAFKIPIPTLTTATKDGRLKSIPGHLTQIFVDELRELIQHGRIGHGPKAVQLQRKRS